MNNKSTFLVLADLHDFGIFDIDMLCNLQYDICITLGDICSEYLSIIRKIVPENTPFYGVYGNHDSKNILSQNGILELQYDVGKVNNLTFTGFNGGLKYREGDFQISQKQSLLVANKMPKADILFAHDCRYNNFLTKSVRKYDKPHSGLKGINKYVKINKPKFVVSGHHHIMDSFSMKNLTEIIVYKAVLFHVFDHGIFEVEHIF